MESTQQRGTQVEVTGWDADNESISWDGWGRTEDLAIADATQRGGIVEIGDVTVIAVDVILPPRLQGDS